MQVKLLGTGGGFADSLTKQAQAALQNADLILGAQRLIEHLPDGCTQKRIAAIKPTDILYNLQNSSCESAVVLFSGDTGFYSGTRSLLPLLRDAGIDAEVLPGLSSVQLLSAALQRPWQDWLLVSAHGVACNPIAAVMQGRPVLFLTGGTSTPASLCRILADAGLSSLQVTVGENLGTPKQCIRTGTARHMAETEFAPLAVLLTERAAVPPQRAPGWPDDWFIRGKVPMTKQIVRAAAISKLAPARTGEVLWDVGAGTGSVSIELCSTAPGSTVYAIETDDDAVALIQQNRNKFNTWNLKIVHGRAPQALQTLPAPDRVFIGGSKGELSAICDVALAKNPKVRFCIAAITLETVSAGLSFAQEHKLPIQVSQLAVSDAKSAGELHLMMAQNPIFLLSVNCYD